MDWILIAAIGQNGEMGWKNQLPWHHPEDLEFFKNTTKNSPLIMGRKTFESLPGVLKGRPHCVLSQSPGPERLHKNVFFFSNIDQISQWCSENGYHRAFIIGGQQIYALLGPLCSQIIITHIQHSFEADTFFPTFLLEGRPILRQELLTGASFQEYSAHITTYGPNQSVLNL